MKRDRFKMRSICAVIAVTFFTGVCILSYSIGSGRGWITLFGKDFGYANGNGAIVVTIAPGGFFHWWMAFAEREYEPVTFGIGYDPLELKHSEHATGFNVSRSFEDKVMNINLPFWLIAFIGAPFLLFAILQKGRVKQGLEHPTPEPSESKDLLKRAGRTISDTTPNTDRTSE